MPNILTENDSIENKYAKLRKRLADVEYKSKAKIRKRNAKAQRKKYRKAKKLREAEAKSILKKESRKLNPYWRIIVTSRNKVLTDILYTPSKDDAIQKYNKILIENKKDVRMPKKVIISGHDLFDAKYEILLLKRKKETDIGETLLRNEYGQLAPNITNSDKWVIYQKSEFYFEEAYWVYGFHPRHQRKCFKYIFEEILLRSVENISRHQKNVLIYKNKLIIEDENYNFDMVICKTHEECIRLYNELKKETTQLKLKSIFWSGFVGDAIMGRLIDRIKEKTGWDNKKITRSTTRP